jgi:hypothetical protein
MSTRSVAGSPRLIARIRSPARPSTRGTGVPCGAAVAGDAEPQPSTSHQDDARWRRSSVRHWRSPARAETAGPRRRRLHRSALQYGRAGIALAVSGRGTSRSRSDAKLTHHNVARSPDPPLFHSRHSEVAVTSRPCHEPRRTSLRPAMRFARYCPIVESGDSRVLRWVHGQRDVQFIVVIHGPPSWVVGYQPLSWRAWLRDSGSDRLAAPQRTPDLEQVRQCSLSITVVERP